VTRIKTAGDLRGFLAEVMQDIRRGNIEADQANAISKVAAQINNSLAVEVNTALRLAQMGKDQPIAGAMLIGAADDPRNALPAPDADGLIWCDQCDERVTEADALGCKSPHCKVKA
jgi:hypothetical protein